MSLGQPDRVWGIALVTTAVSLAAYGLLSKVAEPLSWRSVTTLSMGEAIKRAEDDRSTPPGRARLRILLLVAAATLPFLFWQALPEILRVSPVVARTPLSLWSYLVTGPDAATVRQSLVAAARQTLPMALGGMVLGCSASLLLALAAEFHPVLAKAVLPGVILLQSTPLVALTPLIILVLGRGALATFAIALSVCFFPAFVTLSQAVKTTPQAALDIMRLYDASRFQTLRFVIIPYITPYLFAATRLVAPTALLGVMTAEWLATGYGLGGLMNEARGDLDYGMIWTVAFISVTLSAGLYQLVLAIERPTLRWLFRR